MDEPDFRELTDDERAVLARLLEVPFEGRDEVKAQLKGAVVREIAGAGDHSGSIEFKVKKASKAPVRWSVPVEGVGHDVDGVEVDYLLHFKNGLLDELEIVKADGSPLKRKPPAAELSVRLLSY